MNWLNLCSGGEIGRQAVKELGLPVKNWFSSEIDKFAIKVARDNHDDIIHIGDIRGVLDNIVSLKNIDVILCGSPCQGFSVAGKGLNFEHPQSKLFFEFVKRGHNLDYRLWITCFVAKTKKACVDWQRNNMDYLDRLSQKYSVNVTQ